MSDGESNGPRRPLLAQGELLTTKADKGGGGGPKFHPLSFDEAYRLLAPQGEQLQADISHIPREARGEHVVVEATLHPNYLAGSYHPAGVLAETGLYVVGARLSHGTLKTPTKVIPDQPTRTLLLAGSPSGVARFAKLTTTNPSVAATEWNDLRRFSAISVPRPERIIVRRPELAEGEIITWESVLTPIGHIGIQREEWIDDCFARWAEWIRKLGGEIATDYRRRVGDLTFVPVALHGEALEQAAQFNPLRALRPMPAVRMFPEAVQRAAVSKLLPPSAPKPTSKDLVVGVFDGGVDATSPYFSPFVSAEDLTSEPPDPAMIAHGTLVTSALLYGHIDPDRPLPQPIASVRHYRVFPMPAPGGVVDTRLYWALDQMKAVVERDDLRFVSSSFGPDECMKDHEPSRWTAELDDLAHRRGVTILCAVGNNGREDATLGFNRVQIPADMVNGIGVGACSSANLRRPAIRAPYSAIGPGREGQRVQPTLVAFGGSDTELFRGVDAEGRLLNSLGTSFATPLTMRAICDLTSALDPKRRRPAIARTFGVHFADRRRGHRHLELGYGRVPLAFEHVWECDPHTCTVLYEQELRRDAGPIAMRFPIPIGLPESTPLEIEWTIGFTTDIDPKDPVDYTLSGIETTLRPHQRMYTVTHPKDKTKRLTLHADRDRDQMATLIAASWARSDVPVAQAGWRKKSEVKLRDEGKWETLIRGRLKGDTSTIFNPRLDIIYLRRAGGALVSGADTPPLQLTLLATVRVPVGVPLYDLVRAQFRVLTPLVRVDVPFGASPSA